MARRDAAGVRLLTRNGLDWSRRYPGMASAVGKLRCRSCLLDGEVVISGEDGIPVFALLRYRERPGRNLPLCLRSARARGREVPAPYQRLFRIAQGVQL